MELRSGPEPAPAAAEWQRVWLDAFDCDMPSCVPYPRAPVSALLETAARLRPDHPACTLYGRKVTYARLDEQARRLARSLADLGARPGRCVGMLLPNIPEYLVALQATWLTGATALQLSPLMVAEEVAHWLEATGCHIVVTLDLLAPAVIGALDRGPLEHVVVASLAERLAPWWAWLYRFQHLRKNGSLRLREDAHRHHLKHLLEAEPLPGGPPVAPEEDVAVLAPTGGTTSSPKAVMLTHRNLVANAMQLRHWTTGVEEARGILGVLPFFHCYGLTVGLLGCWARAGTVHLYPRFEAKAVVSLLEHERIELVPAVPAMLRALNHVLRKRPRDLSFIRAVVCGASALDAGVREEWARSGAQELVEGYGLTEASPVTHVNPLGSGNRPGTIGLPLADTEAKVVDPADCTKELPVGEVGELAVRGPQVMKGYFNNPQATAQALRDGWLCTGDMARRDKDGYYSIVDRKKDIIKTSGFLVFPAEVEEVLGLFPGVAEAAVVGVPDAERGEVVKALVVPREGGKIDVDALDGYCREHLSKHKRPRQIEVVPELPKNFLGKVLRRKVREGAGGNGNGHA
ncbi:MAG TPA: AMP-binding protein [Gemmataceae bacterium]|nr:AMP-binding protein [Gemmataceae bacterium]